MEKLSSDSYRIGLINGYPTIDTVNDFAQSGLPEWNLYMQLAKLIPEMPQQHVSKGFTWERNAVLPIKTDQGTMDCEIYRYFKIDGLSPKNDSAYISWRFTYGSAAKPDASKILKYVPIAGSGNGSAVIDIPHGFIVSAEIEFTTPVVAIGLIKSQLGRKPSMQYQAISCLSMLTKIVARYLDREESAALKEQLGTAGVDSIVRRNGIPRF